jgi:hypothetical protein
VAAQVICEVVGGVGRSTHRAEAADLAARMPPTGIDRSYQQKFLDALLDGIRRTRPTARALSILVDRDRL